VRLPRPNASTSSDLAPTARSDDGQVGGRPVDHGTVLERAAQRRPPAAATTASATAEPQESASIVRPRLLDRLDASRQQALTIVVAPAGYGKDVLVDHWIAELDRRGRSYVRLRPDRLRSFGPLPDLDGAALVIEGVDVSQSSPWGRELARAVAAVPDGTPVLVTGRRRWITRLRRGEGTGGREIIDHHDLSFTSDEIQQLVTLVAGRALAPPQLGALEGRTSGWPVAVHIAALALRRDDARVVIGGLADQRHLASYVREEIIRPAPGFVQSFLRRCSVLDALHPSLCSALTTTGAAELLEDLRARNLFLDRVPGTEPWYVLHPLVRDVLRRELQADQAEAREILSTAADWYRDRGESEQAARLLALTERWDDLLDLIDRQGSQLFARGRGAEALGWLDAIPTPSRSRRHGVALRRAAFHTMGGHVERAEEALLDLDPRRANDAELAAAQSLRAAWAFFDAVPAASIEAGDTALGLIDRATITGNGDASALPGLTSPGNLRLLARAGRARSLWHLGHTASARRELSALTGDCEAFEAFGLRVCGTLALVEAWAGEVASARRLADQLLSTSTVARFPRVELEARLASAHVHRQAGAFDDAGRELHDAYDILDHVRCSSGEAITVVEQAQLLHATGDPGRALELLTAHGRSSDGAGLPIVDDRLRAVEIQVRLSVGAVEHAAALVDAAPRPLLSSMAAASVQVAIVQGDFRAAQLFLGDLARCSDGVPGSTMVHDLLAAVIHLETGERRCAIDQGERAVRAILDRGNQRLMLDLGRPVARLLRTLADDDLVAMAEVVADGGAPLSERELEIVRYLPTPLSSTEIAAELYISLNTLKTHLGAIYRKLDARDRRDAVLRAVERGLA
jgi:LuxR family transcriptional regulator, maltose regulon positive regulatory protein